MYEYINVNHRVLETTSLYLLAIKYIIDWLILQTVACIHYKLIFFVHINFRLLLVDKDKARWSQVSWHDSFERIYMRARHKFSLW